jgi:cytochrome c biogenesis protein CcdA
MDSIFLGGSLLAAFLAGAIALFAPCCIVFMFPSYLAVAVRNRRWRLLPLTLIFASGIAVVLVPVTLGVGVLTRSLLRFHGTIYAVGGGLLLLLALLAVTGKTWALPMMRSAPDVSRTDTGGVFALGVFSGAASACCAPVLAGVLTLSAVSPSLLQGVSLGLAYVFGMVFPLVVLTTVWDRAGLSDRPMFRGHTVRWRLGTLAFVTNTFDLIAATMFSAMGIVLLVVAITGATIATDFQISIARWLEDTMQPIVAFLEPVPDLVIGLLLLAIGIGAAAASGRARSRSTTQEQRNDDDENQDTPEAAPIHEAHQH